MRATSAAEATRIGRRAATATTGVTSNSLTGMTNRSSSPTTRTPAATGVEPDLLGRLAQGGRRDVGVVGLGLAAGQADLAAVVAVAGARSVRTIRARPSASG